MISAIPKPWTTIYKTFVASATDAFAE
jgi:hypothetical protein